MIAARWGTLDKLPPKGGAPTGERGADRLISAARTVCRSVDVKGHAGHVWGVPKATAEAEHERRATVHEPLPPGDQPISEDEVMAAMMEVFRRAGTPPHIVYAAQKTGRIVTTENQHLLSSEELAEWNAAVAEYRLQ